MFCRCASASSSRIKGIYHQIVLYGEVTLVLYRIDRLSGLLEQLYHLVLAFANLEALRVMLLTLNIDAAGQLFQALS